MINLSFVAGLNFLVNVGDPTSDLYSFFGLDQIHIIKNKYFFNTIIGSIFVSGGMSNVLFFLQIRDQDKA